MNLKVRLAGTKRKLNLTQAEEVVTNVYGDLTVKYPDGVADVIVPRGRWVNVERINQ